ncbi:transcriptional regulator [Vibrio anguillarum]|uniref:Transcriptional regulator n=1 Tax=Vibrio anguillarum TaxID=55601 RepID=A0AAW4B7U8_VIBAN|nr:ChrR family anti-sigma-E factor [Vibrio anguillarum]ASG08119.1 transcriptional regulator [Vibrio anguillarum]MBF4433740.1 transcriptional regulator [Vibrio anguillarum]
MSHHPSNEVLQQYANGSIDAAHGIMIATHLDLCTQCRQQVQYLETRAAEALLSQSLPQQRMAASNDDHLNQMFETITALDTLHPSTLRKPEPIEIKVNDRVIMLPSTLSQLIRFKGEWRSYGGKVFSAHLDIAEDSRMNLMYINHNVQIPQHTHKGVESTLVLHGGFSDEDGHYQVGDFIQRDASIKHSPFTKVDEDCLCLTVLTEPMLFTQGVARVFNLFGKGLYP